MKKSPKKLSHYQKFILQIAPALLMFGALLFIGSGIFIFLDDRQPNPNLDGSIAIGIGLLVIVVIRPLLNSLIKKANEDDKKATTKLK